MTCRVRILCTECRSKCINVAECLCISLSIQLATYGKACLLAKEILCVIYFAVISLRHIVHIQCSYLEHLTCALTVTCCDQWCVNIYKSSLLEEFVDGEIVTFDGVADANAEPIYAASHVTPDSIMEIAHGKKSMWYYVAPEISPELRKMGEAALKAFGAKSRFFHLEFFRLKTAKPSLGNAGDILGLEVNMRPAGGYTVDMLNYAGGLDLYQIWADMVAFGAAHHPLARYHRYCCCAGRHDELRYRMPHEELLKKYRSCLNAAPRLPEVLAREMGDQLYIASFEDEAAMQAFRRDALARPRE